MTWSPVQKMNNRQVATGASDNPVADEDLVAAAKNGDEPAFEALFKRYQSRVFALALRYTRVREDAEDVVQQTFKNVFVYLSRFEGKSSFSTWLTRIAINEALMWSRKARTHREVLMDNSSLDEKHQPDFDVVDASPDPETIYLRGEEALTLSMAIKRLTPALRIVIELMELRELSGRETARHMGLSLAAVKSRMSRGKHTLRKHIAHAALRTSLMAHQ